MNTHPMDFEDKRVLVTGAAGGIGQEVVSKLIAQGAHVVLSDIDPQALETICEEHGSRARFIAGDLMDPNFCDSLATRASVEMNGLDIVANIAGLIRRGNVINASDQDWALSMGVNVEAVFRICRDSIRLMTTQNGGAIVNVASCWGIYPGPDHVVYCTSKAAVAAMTKCLGRDHAHAGIRVNAVAPNEVDTPMLRSGFEARGLNAKTAIDDLNKTVPLGRIAHPQDIADVILFLASDQSRYLCGACIEVSGGKAVY